jgi:tRNA nucleotidyltransferase/poly(A) polymerase
MSDYMFMLESHLSAAQNRVVAQVQTGAAQGGLGLFLAGGAMRDMLGGNVIRDLDFTVEGNAVKLAKSVAATAGAVIRSMDDHRKCVELVFPGDVTAEISMARQERYPKPGARPQVTPATIHEDLRRRDFTINSIALSLNRASRGLLLDPTNGLADLERRELRAVSNYSLYDDPVRMLRLVRLQARLGFQVAEKTQSQFEHAREAGMENKIPPRSLFEELRHIADEQNAAEVVRLLDAAGFLRLFSPALTGARVNLAGLAKLQKARQLIPFGLELRVHNLGLFLYLLTEKLTPKEKQALIHATEMQKHDADAWLKLEARAKKLEAAAKSAKLQKPSQVYRTLVEAPGDQVLFLLVRSDQRLVQDRIKNFLQKYLPAAQEVTDAEVSSVTGLTPGTPKFVKARDQVVATRLDARPKKAPPAEAEPVHTPAPVPAAAARK